MRPSSLQVLSCLLQEQRLVFFSADWARLTLVAESLLLYLQVGRGGTLCLTIAFILFLRSVFSCLLTSLPASVLAAALCSCLVSRNAGLCHGPYSLPDGLSHQSLWRGCCSECNYSLCLCSSYTLCFLSGKSDVSWPRWLEQCWMFWDFALSLYKVYIQIVNNSYDWLLTCLLNGTGNR